MHASQVQVLGGSFSASDVLLHLGRTPGILRSIVAGLPAGWMSCTEGPGTWSPAIVVAHLAHAERENWPARVSVFLNRWMNRELSFYSPDPAPEESLKHTVDDALGLFEKYRSENIELLSRANINEALLASRAIHPKFGEVHFQQLLSAWVVHDLSHITQIARTISSQYATAVGPWAQNLRILSTLNASRSQ